MVRLIVFLEPSVYFGLLPDVASNVIINGCFLITLVFLLLHFFVTFDFYKHDCKIERQKAALLLLREAKRFSTFDDALCSLSEWRA